MNEQRILFIGVGKLGGQILDLFLRTPGNQKFLVGGRNTEALQQRVNLSRLAALQLGYSSKVDCTFLDLKNIEQTASIIAHFQPDIIFSAATLQPLGGIEGLPYPLAQQLVTAPLGPRLPFAILLLHKLMQAVHLAGMKYSPKVLNAVFPDMVHPILEKINLAPTVGIGDLANNIPALRLTISEMLGIPLKRVDVRLIMARWVSYWISRKDITNAPFSLTVLVDGEDCTHLLDKKRIFDTLRTKLKRIGGDVGLLMTATSATVVFNAIIENHEIITHVPGPNGLAGGYPVRLNANRVEVVLPPGLRFEDAKQINEAGLQLDGIQRIDSDGTVFFTEVAVNIYQETLGYTCAHLPLSEVDERAQELEARYQERKSPKSSSVNI